MRVWDLTTGTPVGDPLTGHTSTVEAVAALLLPDGRPIAVTGGWDGTVRVWDLTTGTPLGDPLTGHTDTVTRWPPCCCPTGARSRSPAAGTHTVRVWDLSTGTPLGDPLTGHTDPVVAVAALVLPDGRPIAVTGSYDDTVRVWDLTTGTPVGDPLTGHTSGGVSGGHPAAARRPPDRDHRQPRPHGAGVGPHHRHVHARVALPRTHPETGHVRSRRSNRHPGCRRRHRRSDPLTTRRSMCPIDATLRDGRTGNGENEITAGDTTVALADASGALRGVWHATGTGKFSLPENTG